LTLFFKKKNSAFSFAPQINPTSQFLECQNTLKFIQNHPLDEEDNEEKTANPSTSIN